MGPLPPAWRRRPVGRVADMVAANLTWGAPRIHVQVLMLGVEVSDRTVSRFMPRSPADPEARQRWRTFLANHRKVIAAIDFFMVPTVTFRVLYVFFIIRHARRTVLHIRVTQHPTAAWITQQLREAFPYDTVPTCLILNRDAKNRDDVLAAIDHVGIRRKQIMARKHWQNGVAERWGATARRDLLDHVIVLNERHLQWLLADLVAYYYDDRTHLSLEKQTPAMRILATRPTSGGAVVAHPRLGGLHHRYALQDAA